MISNLYPPAAVGGYETRCAHTAQWLARRHDVLVLTSRRGRRAAPDASALDASALDASALDAAAPDASAPGPPAPVRVLRELPFLREGPAGTLKAPFAALFAAWRLRRLVDRYRPDLVFVWNASQIPRAAIRALHMRGGVPLAFSVADPWLARFVEGDQFLCYLGQPGGRPAGQPPGRPRRAWSLLARLVNRLAPLRVELDTPLGAALAWNSQALRDGTAVPRCIEPMLERVIHPASGRESLFAAVKRTPVSTPTIAYVGRIEREKAPDVAVRALALLRERHGIGARLVMMGGGRREDCSELEGLVRKLGLAERVQLRGRVAVEEVAAALGEAHAIVVPSRWQEPFGLVCLEAALAGVPVVASRSGGMPEMLSEGQEALFFEIDDVDACAAALATTLSDPDGAEERARRARERAEDYSLARYRAAYDAFVEEAREVGAGRALRSPTTSLSSARSSDLTANNSSG